MNPNKGNILQLMLGCANRSMAIAKGLLENKTRIVSVIALSLLVIAIVVPTASAGLWDWSSSAKTAYDSWYTKFAKITAALSFILFVIVGILTIVNGFVHGFNKALEGLTDKVLVLFLLGVFLGLVTIILLAAEALSGL